MANLLREGFAGKAVAMLPEYPHMSVMTQMTATIDRMTRVVSGPLYYGEAEILILEPLLAIAADILKTKVGKVSPSKEGYLQGAVIKKAYELSAAYAVITEYAKISQAKDLANAMTADVVKNTPVYSALAAQYATDPDAPKVDPNAKVWEKLDAYLKKAGSLKTIQSLISLSMEGDVQSDNVASVFTRFTRTLRKGKGFYLVPKQRAELITIRSAVRAAIEHLISEAENSASDKYLLYAEAMTLSYWYLTYLTIAERYDDVFPAGEYISQSQAWVLSLRTAAARLSAAYSDIAVLPYSFDIQLAVSLHKQAKKFYEPILLDNSAMKDGDAIFDASVATFERVANKFAVTAANSAIDKMVSYSKATTLLPAKYQTVLETILSQVKLEIDVTADKVMSDTLATSTYELILVRSNEHAASMLNDSADIVSAIEYVARAKAILALDFSDDAPFSELIPSGIQYQEVLPLKGSVGEAIVAGFSGVDPLTLKMEKYKYDSTSAKPKWVLADYLYKPVRQIPLLQSLISTSEYYLWPSLGEIPFGDPISKLFATLPLPACYTQTRNIRRLPYDITTFTDLTTGMFGRTPSGEIFQELALLLTSHRDEFGSAIADYLSALFFIYEFDLADASPKVRMIAPTLPAIFGMPRQAMIDANILDGENALTSKVSAGRATKVSVGTKTYWFTLHAAFPKARPTLPVAYSPSRGVTLTIPIFQEAVYKAIEINVSKGGSVGVREYPTADVIGTFTLDNLGFSKSAFISPSGFAPFSMLLPHMLFDVQKTNTLTQSGEFTKYAVASISTKISNVTGDMKIAGFLDNPIVIYDLSDWNKARDEEDPTPTSVASVDEGTSIRGGQEQRGSETHENTTLRPVTVTADNSERAAREAAARVSSAPILHEAAEQGGQLASEPTAVSQPGAQPELPQKTVIAGSPISEPTSSNDATPSSAEPVVVEKYYKIKKGEEWEYVVLKDGDEIPSGAIPCSKEEYLQSKA